jgi:hypothetical protein
MTTSYNQGNADANTNKNPADVSTQPWQAQQGYNAGYANGK